VRRRDEDLHYSLDDDEKVLTAVALGEDPLTAAIRTKERGFTQLLEDFDVEVREQFRLGEQRRRVGHSGQLPGGAPCWRHSAE
jgi:hypothetical protein